MIKILACLLLGCVVLTFGARQKRIAHGRKLTDLEFPKFAPFVVYVDVCSRILCHKCTGTLVATNHVLLSAHCFCDLQGRLKIVKVWSNSMKRDRNRPFVAGNPIGIPGQRAYRCRKPHLSQVDKDIALVALHQHLDITPAPLLCEETSGVYALTKKGEGRLVRVDKLTQTVKMGESAVMFGFGTDQHKISDILRFGIGRIRKCPPRWKHQKVFCLFALYKKSAATDGDSGGPLMIIRRKKYYMIGIASVGSTAKTLSSKRAAWNVWTDVRHFCQGIKNTLKQRP